MSTKRRPAVAAEHWNLTQEQQVAAARLTRADVELLTIAAPLALSAWAAEQELSPLAASLDPLRQESRLPPPPGSATPPRRSPRSSSRWSACAPGCARSERSASSRT